MEQSKVQCECGSSVSKKYLTKHRQSKKHLTWEEQNPPPPYHPVVETGLEADMERVSLNDIDSAVPSAHYGGAEH
jgi:hypothetical protein